MNVTPILTSQFERIPPALQDLALSDAIRERIEVYASQKNLTVEDVRLIENEVMFVILGLEDRADLEHNLNNKTRVGEMHARALANIISEEFFTPVQQDFENLEKHLHAADELTTSTEEPIASEQMLAEDEEHLSRDEILAQIENPQPTQPRQRNANAPSPSDRGYIDDSDPYREPLQ